MSAHSARNATPTLLTAFTSKVSTFIYFAEAINVRISSSRSCFRVPNGLDSAPASRSSSTSDSLWWSRLHFRLAKQAIGPQTANDWVRIWRGSDHKAVDNPRCMQKYRWRVCKQVAVTNSMRLAVRTLRLTRLLAYSVFWQSWWQPPLGLQPVSCAVPSTKWLHESMDSNHICHQNTYFFAFAQTKMSRIHQGIFKYSFYTLDHNNEFC